MSATDLLRLLHVASAFWFVAGLLGRDTAFRDPVVAGARWYELVVVGAVLVLMVTKPF